MRTLRQVRSISQTSLLLFLPIVVALALVSMALDSAATWWAGSLRDRVRGYYEALEETRQAETVILDAESSTRGYIITGEPQYLERYHLARDDVFIHLARLATLTADNPAQRLRLDRLERQVAARLRTLDSVIASKQPDGIDAARQIIHTQQSDKLMTAVRATLGAIEHAEQARLSQGIDEAELNQWYATLFSAGGNVLALLAALVAFHALKRHEVQLRAAEAAASQARKMEAIGQLTGGIAHDFNNLLQVVITNLDLAFHKLEGNRAIAGLLRNATLGAERGAKLTSQLLTFARRQPLRPQVVRIDRAVREIADLLRRTLGERIEIEEVGSGDPWRTLADPALLQTAILNLALNARDAMPDGGKLTIEVGNAVLDAAYASRTADVTPGQYVMLAVSDTGAGMTPEVAARAFEPFFTTKPEGAGTGLGLAMVYGFVKQSGGHIKIYSEPGHGTTVKLYLPRTQMEEDVIAAGEKRPPRGANQSILVVEDDEAVRAGVTAQLSELGYRVVAAADGEAALEVLAGDRPVDLLFTDVILPGAYNGRLLAEEARRRRPGLPVIYTSGYTENAIIHHGRLDEGVTLLSKPYRTTDLASAIETALADAPVAAKPPAPLEVLVVEDDKLVRMSLAVLLSDWGCRVREAGDADEALQVLDEGFPHGGLMIADLGLPGRDGLALAADARARRPGLAIVIATGQPALPESANALAGPPPRLLTKPFTAEELRAVIDGAVAA